jgi:predicted amidohydrolase YtcJ
LRPHFLIPLAILVVVNAPLNAGRARSIPAGAAHNGTVGTPSSGELSRGADLILLHGKIWTGEPYAGPGERPVPAAFAQAVAMANGRILAVGSSDQIRSYVGPNTRVIDLKGRLAVPGFIDSHVHFMAGSFQLLEVNLKDTRDEADFTRRLGEKAKTLPAGRWIEGGNWDEEAWPDAKLPTRWMIDSVTPHNPVFIYRYDGHAALANSLALKLAGVTKDTSDPAGGVVVRDPKTGEPTGVFKDAAQRLVEQAVPLPSEAEFEEALKAGLAEARRVGVTSVQDISVGSDSPNGSFTGEIRWLHRAEREGWLTCRFYAITPIAEWQKLRDAGISHDMGSDFVKMGAVKGFADGSLGSRTAWMYEPYTDDPGNRGLPMPLMHSPSRRKVTAEGCDKAGIQLAVHAIGDRAIAEVLEAFGQAGGHDARSHRFRIEHAQHVRAQDFARFGRLGVIASMQPYHAIDDGRWAEKRIGHERARTSYAWRAMLEAGAPLAFGTDWPVAPLNPLLGVYAAVTRATLDGKHPAGWFPEQRLTLEEALRAYTQGSAYAAFEEKQKGTIAPGKLADLVVLSDDLFSVPPEKIKDARAVLTVVGGNVVYEVP